MRNSTLLPIVVALLTITGTPHAIAQMDVDQADSLNFEGFHKDKKEAKKVWKDETAKKAETVKAYEQTPAAVTAPAALTTTPVAATSSANNSTNNTATAAGKPGQRFEIRERYSLERSAQTPYSAFYVIESLHKQSAKLCSKGWKKLTERSEPIEQDFYMFYEIECL